MWDRWNFGILTLDSESTWKMGPGNIWYAMFCWCYNYANFGNHHQICHSKGCEPDIKMPSLWHVVYMSFCVLLHINHPNWARSYHSFLGCSMGTGKPTVFFKQVRQVWVLDFAVIYTPPRIPSQSVRTPHGLCRVCVDSAQKLDLARIELVFQQQNQ